MSEPTVEDVLVGDDLIRPAFTTVDGLTIRYATSPKPAAETVVLLRPWPESIYAIKNYDVPSIVRDDYVKSYSGDRFAQSVAYVQSYPSDLEALAPELPSLRTPVQVLVGRDDPYGLASDAALLNQKLTHSRLQTFPTGHNAWEEDPAAYADAIIEWVNGGYRGV